MNTTGPLPVTPIPHTTEVSPVLRVHQRITGEVMQISAGQVTLMVDGVPIVAQLSAPEQAAELQAQRMAHFVVKEIVDGQVLLQTLKPGAQTAAAEMILSQTDTSLAGRVLEEAGLPVTASTLTLARALLAQGLEITPAALMELEAALGGTPTEPEAQLAAALKAAGLPVTPGSLALARQEPDAAGALLHLLEQLRTALQNENVPGRAALYQQAVQVLQAAVPDWNIPTAQLAQQLRTAAMILGQPLEQLLAGGADSGAPTLLDLAQLYRAARGAPPALMESLDHFLDSLRSSQLFNTGPRSAEQSSGWSQMDFVLRLPGGQQAQGAPEQFFAARLRVARRHPQNGGSRVDPDYTRIVIQVELAPKQTIQVDLAIARSRVQAEVTTPGPETAGLAQEELPILVDRLTRMGYTLQSARVQVGHPPLVGGLPDGHLVRLSETTLDVEV